jgi:predicted RNase H-like HicB family nuclease
MTYTFNVVVEPDEDRWYAECPVLVRQGAATWGDTKVEALSNIQEVVRMVVESLIEHGEAVPESPADQVQVTVTPRVAITV